MLSRERPLPSVSLLERYFERAELRCELVIHERLLQTPKTRVDLEPLSMRTLYRAFDPGHERGGHCTGE